MPDHFHGVIHLTVGASLVDAMPDPVTDGRAPDVDGRAPTRDAPTGPALPALGDVIGAFKSICTNAYIRGVRDHEWPRYVRRVWHRNFHDRIIRDPDHLKRARRYTRMNPWRLCQTVDILGTPFQCIGNLALLERSLRPFQISRQCSAANVQREVSSARTLAGDHRSAAISGFHSPGEKECLQQLLKSAGGIVLLPACATEALRVPEEWLPALKANQMLIASPFDTTAMRRQTALIRNEWVKRIASTCGNSDCR